MFQFDTVMHQFMLRKSPTVFHIPRGFSLFILGQFVVPPSQFTDYDQEIDWYEP